MEIRPKYYIGLDGTDVIAVIQNFQLGFLEGNIIKYLIRHGHKNGVEDLEKARTYINRLIEAYDNGDEVEKDVQTQDFKEGPVDMPKFSIWDYLPKDNTHTGGLIIKPDNYIDGHKEEQPTYK